MLQSPTMSRGSAHGRVRVREQSRSRALSTRSGLAHFPHGSSRSSANHVPLCIDSTFSPVVKAQRSLRTAYDSTTMSDFPPLKNDLLLRAARGAHFLISTLRRTTSSLVHLQEKRQNEHPCGSCDRQVAISQVRPISFNPSSLSSHRPPPHVQNSEKYANHTNSSRYAKPPRSRWK